MCWDSSSVRPTNILSILKGNFVEIQWRQKIQAFYSLFDFTILKKHPWIPYKLKCKHFLSSQDYFFHLNFTVKGHVLSVVIWKQPNFKKTKKLGTHTLHCFHHQHIFCFSKKQKRAALALNPQCSRIWPESRCSPANVELSESMMMDYTPKRLLITFCQKVLDRWRRGAYSGLNATRKPIFFIWVTFFSN